MSTSAASGVGSSTTGTTHTGELEDDLATTYKRLRMFWGALDIEQAQAQTPSYGPTEIVTGGPSAVVGSGIGVRRCTIVLDRQNQHPSADVAVMHFDFLNTTGGSPDDTWILADYTVIEGYLNTMFNALTGLLPAGVIVTRYIWHRVGTGVSKPNPAERDYTLVAPISGGGAVKFPPQVACSITFRTAVRKSWGRTYLPYGRALTTTATMVPADADALAGAVNTMVTSAAGSDMHLVVVSKPLASSLNVEKVEVDDVLDIIRRRRWKSQTYRKILP